MFSYRLIIPFLFCLYSTSSYPSDDKGFDEVCNIYTEVMNSNMPTDVSSNYIITNIQKRVTSNDAQQAHVAIMEAMGETRYSLFKTSAEHILKRPWDCASMRSMFNINTD